MNTDINKNKGLVVTLMGPAGAEDFEHLDVFSCRGRDYAVLLPQDPDDTSVNIMRVYGGPETRYEYEEDMEVKLEVYRLFREAYKHEFRNIAEL